MASIQFRFTTECEMTLHGATYEDIYLQFKDFIHGDQRIANRAAVSVFPPESVQVFFDLEANGRFHEIPQFKGSYKADIVNRCLQAELDNMPLPMRAQRQPRQQRDEMLSGWYGS